MSANPRSFFQRHFVTGGVVGLCLLLTVAAFGLVRHRENALREAEFKLDAEDWVHAIQQGVQLNLEVVRSLGAFFKANEAVDRRAFDQYAQAAGLRHPGLQALQWVPRVTPAERPAFEQAARQEGYPEFRITEQNERGELVAADPRAEYFPIFYRVDFQTNAVPPGFDLASDSIRRQALAQARDTGRVTASGGFSLAPDGGDRRHGFLVAVPVYRRGAPVETVAQRRAELRGFCVGVFRVNQIVTEALKSISLRGVDIAIYDESAPADRRLLEFRPGRPRNGTIGPGEPESFPPLSGPFYSVGIEVAGRQWRIVSAPVAAYLAAVRHWASWAVLWGGLCLTGIVSLALHQHRIRTAVLESRVRQRTEELARANRELHGEVAERKRAEDALRDNQAQMQAILDNATAVIYVKDLQGRYLLVNRRFEALFQATREQLRGRTDYACFPKEMAEAFRANDQKVLAAGQPLELEEVAPQPDGPHTYISVKFPLFDAQGMPYAVGGISTDITQRKQMEAALRTSEERYALIMNGINEGLWDWNLNTNEVYFSPRWKSMLGYADEEIANQFDEWKGRLHPDDLDRAMLAVQAHLDGRAPAFELEHRLRHKDGAYRWILARGILVRDAQGRPTRLAGSNTDITERKQVEQALQKLNAELEQRSHQLQATNKELEAFSYSVSHDLRAPLRHIDGFVDLLKKHATGLEAEDRHFLEIISEAARQMGRLIDDLLVFSRMSRAELHRSRVDLNQVVDEAVRFLQPETIGRNILWTKNPLPNVEADPTMLRQVLVNLLSNAVKYTRPRDPARIEIGCARESPDEVVVYVRDNGVGFDMQYVGKLFGVFQRLHRAEEFEGTGIGLANVRRIIHRHGGRVWAESKLNEGATFHFSLPGKAPETG